MGREPHISNPRLKVYLAVALGVWTSVALLSFFWSRDMVKRSTRELAANEARAHFNKDVAIRLWAARHGGVYVPTDARTPANPNLAHIAERDLVTPSGRKLTLMNPAYMLRQLMAEYFKMFGVQGRIVSRRPLRAGNRADPWERRQLKAFDRGQKEALEVTWLRGEPHLRLMRPLLMRQRCLKCHAFQGYKVGDLRGGVGVAVPLKPYLSQERRQLLWLLVGHLTLWLLGGVIFTIGYRRLDRSQGDRHRAEAALRWEVAVNQALADMAHTLVSTSAVSDVSHRVLEHARSLTSSPHGYVASVDVQSGDLIAHTHTEMTLTDCNIPEQDQQFRFSVGPDKQYPSLWGVSLNRKKSLLSNAPGEHPESRGTPEGHLPISRLLSVPAVSEGEVVGQIALANADRPYIDRDLEAIERLGELYALAVQRARRLEERTRLEAQFRQDHKLKAMGTLAGGIAHDFNNLLAVIMGNLDLVLLDSEEGASATEALRDAMKSGQQARDLVRQILTFSSRREAERVRMSFAPLIEDAHKLLRSSLPATIEIRCRLLAERDVVLADPTQLQQVVMNLCTNASQAMADRGGVLALTLEALSLEAGPGAEVRGPLPLLEPGEYLVLTVSDTGIGMDDDTIERVFEPFFTTKSPEQGTGLGLAIVHGIVASHGGGVSLTSELGVGSTFKVYLPCIQQEADLERPRAISELPRGSECLLIVDDEPLFLKVCNKALERQGYQVHVAASSPEALTMFERSPETFDAVVTDLTMPNMTGLELATAVHAIRPEVPVILMSGFGDRSAEDPSAMEGIAKFISKPVRVQQLVEAVRDVLDKSQPD